MISPGLVSVTFRQLSPASIVTLAQHARLRGIEWGGDIHVPPGNLARAAEVRQLTEDAGIAVVSYGSYYRAAVTVPEEFESVLETAVALGAPNIRVWAGNKGSHQTHAEERRRVRDDLHRIATLASKAGVSVSLEFHDHTLTDSAAAASTLLNDVAHPALRTHWQPPHGEPTPLACDGLRLLLPRLAHLHVFHWWPDPRTRLPLADGADRWAQFLAVAHSSGRDTFALLEFVAGDSVEAFKRDAETLHQLLSRSTNVGAPAAG